SNNRYGLFASGVTTLNVTGATFFNNRVAGLRADGSPAGTLSDILAYENARDNAFGYQNAAALEVRGTFTIIRASVFDNFGPGIAMSSGVVAESKVYDNLGTGISADGTVDVQRSEVFANGAGVVLSAGSV